MSAPLVSIVVVTYHTGPKLDEALAAVKAQTVPVQLILVNNGNPPEVEKALAARFANDPDARFITGHGNIGFGRACNLGARSATAPHLLFLNPDCLLQPDGLQKTLDVAASLKPPYMLGARLLEADGSDQRGCRRALLTPKTAFIEALHLQRFFPAERLNYHEQPLPKSTVPMPAISGAFMFFRAEDYWLVDGFDERYFLHVEDLDLCLRFRRAGGEIYFAPEIIVTHIGSTSNVTSLFLEKSKAKSFSQYFHQNFTGEYPLPFLWLLDLAIWSRYLMKVAASLLKSSLSSSTAARS